MEEIRAICIKYNNANIMARKLILMPYEQVLKGDWRDQGCSAFRHMMVSKYKYTDRFSIILCL